MPRKARVDFPGALHHVIGRGIERRFILSETEEKAFFLERLTHFCRQYDFRCYAWCLMDNHYHLLLETGSVPLCKLMSGLLTGYALFYNRVHRRVGHVFQNRYQSILCEKDVYLLELVRYIHLNPVKAGMVKLTALRRYEWCSHGEMVDGKSCSFVEFKPVLSLFSDEHKEAVVQYEAFVRAGLCDTRVRDFEGGGLRRSLGGDEQLYVVGKPVERINFDQRVLGGDDFVNQILSRLECAIDESQPDEDFESLANKVKTYYDIEYDDLFIRRRSAPYREAQLVLIYLADCYSNVGNQSLLGEYFGIGRTAVSMAIKQGRQVCREKSLEKSILTI